MAEGRRKAAWDHTSSLMALLVNLHRDPKKSDAARPSDFQPYAPRSKPVKVPLSMLRDVFTQGDKPTLRRRDMEALRKQISR